jgi:hypothetical protein
MKQWKKDETWEFLESRDNWIYWRAGQRESGIRFQAGARDFSLLQADKHWGPPHLPNQRVPRVISTAVEWPGCEDEHSHLVNNASTIPSFPPHVFTVRCLIQQCGISSVIHQPFATDSYRIWKFRKQCIDYKDISYNAVCTHVEDDVGNNAYIFRFNGVIIFAVYCHLKGVLKTA